MGGSLWSAQGNEGKKVMYIPTRRFVLLGSAGLTLFGCAALTSTRTPLQMVQFYTDDLADAFAASAQIFEASTSPVPTAEQITLVNTVMAEIQAGRAAVDALTAPTATDGIAIVRAIISDVQKVEPMLAPLLGAAALYLPLALGVLQAFADSLAPPPDAPPVPPAALHAKAVAYRRSKR